VKDRYAVIKAQAPVAVVIFIANLLLMYFCVYGFEMRTVLLTGFEPFGADRVNPSWLAVRRLHGRTLRGHESWRAAADDLRESLPRLRRLLRRVRPRWSSASARRAARGGDPERVATMSTTRAFRTTLGGNPWMPPSFPGPVAYWSTLPVKAIVRALRRQGVPHPSRRAQERLSAITFSTA